MKSRKTVKHTHTTHKKKKIIIIINEDQGGEELTSYKDVNETHER